MNYRNPFCLILVLCTLAVSGQVGNLGKPSPPKRPIPRYLDDYSSYDSIKSKSSYQGLKHLSLGPASYLSLGGEMRYRYEYFENSRFGLPAQDENGYLLDRYLLHADVHTKYFRVFTQLRSNNVYGRDQGPRALDKDVFDLHQLFLEVPFRIFSTPANVSIGRKELFYGSSRWINFREGPNSRLSFDGIVFALEGRLKLDVFYVAPVKIGQEVFDNRPDFSKSITGLYFTARDWIRGNELNLYTLYHKTGETLPANRVSMGLRNKLQSEPLEVDFEAILQLAQSLGTIRGAFSLGLDLNYAVRPESNKLKLGFTSLYASGSDPSAGMTFYPLHPKYSNFRDIGLYVKYNLFYLQPFIQYRPGKKHLLTAESISYWKANMDDHVYYIPGETLSPAEFDARHLGMQINLLYKYYLNPFIQTEVGYRVYYTSNALSAQTNLENVQYLSMAFIFRF